MKYTHRTGGSDNWKSLHSSRANDSARQRMYGRLQPMKYKNSNHRLKFITYTLFTVMVILLWQIL